MAEDIVAFKKHFCQERRYILNDIEQFCNQVSQFLQKTKFDTNVREANLDLLLKSVYFIHGFYFYPAANNGHERESSIKVKKDAVKDLVKQQFGNIYPYVHDDGFWQEIYQFTAFDKLPREPAHLFLELARVVLRKSPGPASELVKYYLEMLPNANRLKPVVWATRKDDESQCGVSVGVRHHIRPIYLCIKLLRLKEKRNNVTLSETEALKRITRVNCNDSLKYDKKLDPCQSCTILFDRLPSSLHNETPKSFTPFGNCAEYDIIHTKNLKFTLVNSETDWKKFYSACEYVFLEFTKLISGEPETQIFNNYVSTMRKNSKILQFVKNGPSYELKANDWWELKSKNRSLSRYP